MNVNRYDNKQYYNINGIGILSEALKNYTENVKLTNDKASQSK